MFYDLKFIFKTMPKIQWQNFIKHKLKLNKKKMVSSKWAENRGQYATDLDKIGF